MAQVNKFFNRLLLFTPLILLLVSINYGQDPAYLYHVSKAENEIARWTANGEKVAVSRNYDERLFQKYFIKEYFSLKTKSPDIVIYGSSRTMELDSSFFPGRVILNHSVSNASLEDFLGITSMHLDAGHLPKEIILALDPPFLNKNRTQNRWTSVKSDVHKMLRKMDINPLNISIPLIPDEWTNLFSLSYFQASLLALKNPTPNRDPEYFKVDKIDLSLSVRLPDGSKTFSGRQKSKNIFEMRAEIESLRNEPEIEGFENFLSLDPQRQILFEAFLKFLKDNGVKVTLLIAPYDPTAYEILARRPDTKILIETEDYIRNVGKRFGLQVLGANNPNSYELKDEDFYDYIHPKPSAYRIIFKRDGI